jgi:hypothetical protein
MPRPTHMRFVGDTPAGEVTPDMLPLNPGWKAADLVPLPSGYWDPDRE